VTGLGLAVSINSASERASWPVHGDAAKVRDARRRRSRHGPAALMAMLAPALGLPFGLLLLRNDVRFEWLSRPATYPWELWAVGACGTVATLGGLADWRVHRSGTTVVGVREHRAHVAALGLGGLPLFGLLAAASLSPRPLAFLLPVLAVLVVTVVLVCYDEFLFHRRCGRYEALMHRLLTIGNGLAFLAWAHWCFVRGGGRG
jgi:hypothetical protein